MPTNAILKWNSNLGFEAKVKDFDPILLDEPAQFHGDDRGPSSLEVLCVGVGGCMGTSLVYCLQKYSATFSELTLNVAAEIHHVPPNNMLRVTGFHVDFIITPDPKTPENIKSIRNCYENFAKFCVVTQSIKQGIPFDLKININK